MLDNRYDLLCAGVLLLPQPPSFASNRWGRQPEAEAKEKNDSSGGPAVNEVMVNGAEDRSISSIVRAALNAYWEAAASAGDRTRTGHQ